MTARNIGPGSFNWFVAKVVNRGDGKNGKKDSTESGRVQLRIHGLNENSGGMMGDETLPWGYPIMPIGSGSSMSGVGKAPIGLKNDSTVIGFFADAERSIPIILGVLHKAGGDSGSDGSTLNSQNNDIPKGSRSSKTGGGDKNDVHGYAITEEEGEKAAKKDQLHHKKKTIGATQYSGQEILDLINQEDSGNESGAIQSAVYAAKAQLDTIAQSGTFMGNFEGLMNGSIPIGQLMGMAQQALAISNGLKSSGSGGSLGGGTATGGSAGVTGSVSGTPITPTTGQSAVQAATNGATAFGMGQTIDPTLVLPGAITGSVSYAKTGTGDAPAPNTQISNTATSNNATSNTSPSSSYIAPTKYTVIVGGIPIDVTIDNDNVSAKYKKIVCNIINYIDQYGSITNTKATLVIDNKQIVSMVSIDKVQAAARGDSVEAASVVEAASSASISNNLAKTAFNNFNPNYPSTPGNQGGGSGGAMQNFIGPIKSILSSLGGLQGLSQMNSENTAAENRILTKNFTPAVATATTLKRLAENMFSGAGASPISMISNIAGGLGGGGLGSIGNIAGVADSLGGIGGVSSLISGITSTAGVYAKNSQFSQAAQSIASAVASTSTTSLINSQIELPSSSVSTINNITAQNPGVRVSVNSGIKAYNTTVAQPPEIVGSVTPNYEYNSSTSNISTLNNSDISVALPPSMTQQSVQDSLNKNSGVNYNLANTK